MKNQVPASRNLGLKSGLPPRFRRAKRRGNAFSLVEMLVVTSIILILLAFIVPSMNSISSGTNLTSAAEELAAVVNLARQRASTFNRQNSIRFFRSSANAPYTSYQLWEQKDSAFPNTWAAVEAMRKLPNGVVVISSPIYSPLLDIPANQGTLNAMNYSEALFLPSGSLVASATSSSITLVLEHWGTTGGIVSGLPTNFATVAIEPVNARPTIYRP